MTKKLIMTCLAFMLTCYNPQIIGASDNTSKPTELKSDEELLKRLELCDPAVRMLIDILFINADIAGHATIKSRLEDRVAIVHDCFFEVESDAKRKLVKYEAFSLYLLRNFANLAEHEKFNTARTEKDKLNALKELTKNGVLKENALKNLKLFIFCLEELICLMSSKQLSFKEFKHSANIAFSKLFQAFLLNINNSSLYKEDLDEDTKKEFKQRYADVAFNGINAFKILTNLNKSSLYQLLFIYKKRLKLYIPAAATSIIYEDMSDRSAVLGYFNQELGYEQEYLENILKLILTDLENPFKDTKCKHIYCSIDQLIEILKAKISKTGISSRLLSTFLSGLMHEAPSVEHSAVIDSLNMLPARLELPGTQRLYSSEYEQILDKLKKFSEKFGLSINILPNGEILFVQNEHITHGEMKKNKKLVGLHIYDTKERVCKLEKDNFCDLKYLSLEVKDLEGNFLANIPGYLKSQIVSILKTGNGVLNPYNNIIASNVGATLYSEYVFDLAELVYMDPNTGKLEYRWPNIDHNFVYDIKLAKLNTRMENGRLVINGESQNTIQKASGSSFFSLNLNPTTIFPIIESLIRLDLNIKFPLSNATKELVGYSGMDFVNGKFVPKIKSARDANTEDDESEENGNQALYKITYNGIEYYVMVYFKLALNRNEFKLGTAFPILSVLDFDNLVDIPKFEYLDNNQEIQLSSDYHANQNITSMINYLDANQKTRFIEKITELLKSSKATITQGTDVYVSININANLLLCMPLDQYEQLNIKKDLPILIKISEKKLKDIQNS